LYNVQRLIVCGEYFKEKYSLTDDHNFKGFCGSDPESVRSIQSSETEGSHLEGDDPDHRPPDQQQRQQQISGGSNGLRGLDRRGHPQENGRDSTLWNLQ